MTTRAEMLKSADSTSTNTPAAAARSEWFDAVTVRPSVTGSYELLTAVDNMLHLMFFDAALGRWGSVGSNGSGDLLFIYPPQPGDRWRGLLPR